MQYELTLASEADEAVAASAGGGNGQGDLLKALSTHPLADAERSAGITSLRRRRIPVDHIHLSRYDGTDLVRWFGRRSNGYHYPLGRLMKMVPVAAHLDEKEHE